MVPLEQLSPGMHVKIVDQWVPGCYQNDAGRMDKYLGQVVTVLEIRDDYILIEEDEKDYFGHWYWNSRCLDCIMGEEYEDFEPASNSEIFSLIIGK